MELSRLVSFPFVYGSIAAALMLLGSAILAIRKGKRRSICWFCQAKQPNGPPMNGWTCVSCQQYNGFAEDGGYDREMTEQYAEGELTPARFCRSDASVAPPTSGAAILCPQCQFSLEMKLVQLAAFQPTSEVYFEEEAEEYERSVEKLYPLCVSCEERVASEISHRNQVIRHHLLATRNSPKTKAKLKVSREGQWFFSLLTWTAAAVSLWTAISLLTQELYCSHGSQCGSILIIQPAPLPPLLRLWDRVQLLEIAGGFSLTDPPLVEERNGTCRARKRKLDWLHLMKPSPSYRDDHRGNHLGVCSVTTSMYFCMVTGFTFSQTLPPVLLLLTDIVYIFSRKHIWESLLLLSTDTIALCTRPSLCSKLHLPSWAPFCSPWCGSIAVVVAFITRLFVMTIRNLGSWKRSSYKERGVRLRSQPRVSVVQKENSVPTQQVLHSSFVGMSIGQQARKKGIARKSWLQSLEEMNLLPRRHDDRTMALPQGNETCHTSSETELTGLTVGVDSVIGEKPLLRPARLRYRRFSISSATAALSLENSSPWSHPDSPPNKEVWPSHLSEMLPNMEIEKPPPPPCEHTVRRVTFPDPDSTSGNETAQQDSPSTLQLQVKGHTCRWRWIVTVLLVASVASNLGLLGLLLVHTHPPW